jgi:hypothetical protein
VTNPRPLLLDSSFLVSYERDLTRRAQALVVEAITEGRILVTAAVSLTAAGAELAGRHPELSWLLDDAEGPVQVLSLSAANALDVGARIGQSGAADLVTIEVAQVVHEAATIRAAVLTYEPKLYVGHAVDVVDMRPR